MYATCSYSALLSSIMTIKLYNVFIWRPLPWLYIRWVDVLQYDIKIMKSYKFPGLKMHALVKWYRFKAMYCHRSHDYLLYLWQKRVPWLIHMPPCVQLGGNAGRRKQSNDTQAIFVFPGIPFAWIICHGRVQLILLSQLGEKMMFTIERLPLVLYMIGWDPFVGLCSCTSALNVSGAPTLIRPTLPLTTLDILYRYGIFYLMV